MQQLSDKVQETTFPIAIATNAFFTAFWTTLPT